MSLPEREGVRRIRGRCVWKGEKAGRQKKRWVGKRERMVGRKKGRRGQVAGG